MTQGPQAVLRARPGTWSLIDRELAGRTLTATSSPRPVRPMNSTLRTARSLLPESLSVLPSVGCRPTQSSTQATRAICGWGTYPAAPRGEAAWAGPAAVAITPVLASTVNVARIRSFVSTEEGLLRGTATASLSPAYGVS